MRIIHNLGVVAKSMFKFFFFFFFFFLAVADPVQYGRKSKYCSSFYVYFILCVGNFD